MAQGWRSNAALSEHGARAERAGAGGEGAKARCGRRLAARTGRTEAAQGVRSAGAGKSAAGAERSTEIPGIFRAGSVCGAELVRQGAVLDQQTVAESGVNPKSRRSQEIIGSSYP